jgi:CBS-domain-containing membrane protein
MRDNRVRRLPVLDQQGRLAGIISLNDLAREAQREMSAGRRAEVTAQGVAETLASVCQPRISREIAPAVYQAVHQVQRHLHKGPLALDIKGLSCFVPTLTAMAYLDQ